ncbi:YceI family protein [Pontibacter oryzae]|uniref:YceI family protein n=1 Tax=Pontibacter oryzae TaxID=2304593 RepID=A0A399RWC8_9BACT|nr:YceI family protein [Pontibacter oryzae]RIJ34122.1 YceI family protein [Pontibacter oryzae]
MKTVLLLLQLLSCFTICAQNIDSNRSEITFSIKNMGLNRVEGTFHSIYGRVILDPGHLQEAQIEAVIDISSLVTGIDMRDRHLQQEDFFDTEMHPVATFFSEHITQNEIGYMAMGVLEIKGRSQAVQIPFTLLNHSEEQLLEGNLIVNRRDFDLGTGMSSLIVGEKVKIYIKCYVMK